MRVTTDGIVRVTQPVAFVFDGETVEGHEGESLAASLTAAGKLSLRHTKSGAVRGIFCGMGVCSECLVTVDGEQNVRACMTALRARMTVESQSFPGTVPEPIPEVAVASPVVEEATAQRPELLIVGAGPAGLAAAKAAALAGVEVVLIDERPALGGQFFKQLARTHAFASDAASDGQSRAGRALIDEVSGLGVRIHSGAMVWGIFGPQDVGVLVDGTAVVFEPSQLILAAGAYERGVPVPGWTLPGFMTTGAAQTLLRAYRVAPGRRVLVGGNGPLNLQVAAELVQAGVDVVAVVEAASVTSVTNLPAAATAFLNSPDLIRDGRAYVRRIRRAGTPILYRHAVVEAHGEDAVASVTVARIGASGERIAGTEREFAVDAVCVGYGFYPANELSRALGCRHRLDRRRANLIVERDDDLQTTVPGVFVAGDCGEMGGARAALEQGFIAGCAAALNLGKTLPTELANELARRRKRLRSHMRFQAALWRLFEAPLLTDQLATDETLVCRCEDVTKASLRAALAEGTETAGAVKRLTRAGMGRCQGRYCGAIIAQLVEAATGRPTEELSYFAPRPPTKPVPIGAIAREHPEERAAGEAVPSDEGSC